jgi:hypothetical protein
MHENRKALDILVDVYRLKKAFLGDNNIETINTLNNMGNVYIVINDYQKAIDCF